MIGRSIDLLINSVTCSFTLSFSHLFIHSFFPFVDAGHDSDTKFFHALGSKGPISSAEEAGDDSEFEKEIKVQVKLYR